MMDIQTTKQYQTIQLNNPMEEALTTLHRIHHHTNHHTVEAQTTPSNIHQQHTQKDITTDTNTLKKEDGKKQNQENGNTYSEIILISFTIQKHLS